MGREIYPGTKCNSVPLFFKLHILFDVFFVPVRRSVFMCVTVMFVCVRMAAIHVCLCKSSHVMEPSLLQKDCALLIDLSVI